MEKKHPEETFKLKTSDNSLSKYHFRKETTEKTGTITNDDDGADQNEEQEEPNVSWFIHYKFKFTQWIFQPYEG